MRLERSQSALNNTGKDLGLAPLGPLMASHAGHVHKWPGLDALPWMLMPDGLALQLPERSWGCESDTCWLCNEEGGDGCVSQFCLRGADVIAATARCLPVGGLSETASAPSGSCLVSGASFAIAGFFAFFLLELIIA
ncbi:MAG: hypothetical protein FRX49_05170 [Trebouxia sp. A1-2]|nr:MAG: hypothetical protein FRX49_05170 [Trebouxia sp. A1-2]